MRTLGRFVFWDFPRASWQYDVMVLLILVFIFAMPPDVFRDKPKAASVVMVRPDTFFIDPTSLSSLSESEQESKASDLIEKRFKIKNHISRVVPMVDDEQEVIGYTAFTKP